ncbi:PREDICTED: 3'(2'),5'-bisphosphate nucleotidase 1 [Dinoponera quadriceps]|uniref:3'(2'),5'-bisphosphate nucleotidase 1 n=1 Tax=Dinoponera quadriceps TaxID=609295 RepID=A0A6P3X346_DINQU|nr:PREDICTED: 3'(2'),5'-bisphosphate nucleotidase 1 [Dinoponera quadriceps]XP_014472700.1 PREDICTED: 3'(2'),5'-bisphosphate nucleotidase 1 [Dinoponera quadriceps]XP_014472701.1 PREDICTED: 3'(2'),5'-bisphosphate nucleotidase 1 [Dinoponera quadriceps]XP_014472702.1 PREDICTED: 3'(2'),5'-bisphosphate nucleotidase 1 [Dinoponera quadriceps]XP_014472703.1 PREDICTED: 3'(2'),5'-bisphosphate nucleotidase 1 [Dinoponera quadriceps]XP_014472704.1 PREDICTED: 3'(2'),5'-bisphosphate nucleotidase 1 [Dinoponera
MAQSAALLTRIMASSVSAAVQAGKIIRDVLSKGGLNIVEKGKNDLQTEADRSAQKCIIASLSRQFPNITIIGEEEPSNCEVPSEWIVTEADQEVLKLKLPAHLEDINPKDVCVWVDPLDGTAEYTQGLVEHVTVLVGVAIGRTAIGGVIHQPYYKNDESGMFGRTLWGIDGAGFGGFVPKPPPEGKRIITTTRSHYDSVVQNAIKSLSPDEVMRVGGAGHKVILLLEGKAHAYVFASRGCKRWDTCAPEAVLHSIGGVLTDLYGERYSYKAGTTYANTRGVLATAPGQSHQWYLSRIPDEVKQNLQ